ncbi:transglutaminase [Pacificimonas flava]|uniref:Transglutaminase n=2 Tax=Pacificimonas TaxID=1960290 RepID=A0A219B678_9SPHN|nr:MULTISPECIES: transglutaminase family protein [Pacificimonas]MBZ6379514.1 transglutaminase family protein [Pacificimonas aurantium]OWV33298.1 transglutaminase [Pacificimonas flava]
MHIHLASSLDYSLSGPSDVLLQVEVGELDDQSVFEKKLKITGDLENYQVPGEDNIGTRRWLRCEKRLTVEYEAKVSVTRGAIDCTDLAKVDMHDLPGDVIKYLMGSQYCDVTKFQSFVSQKFSDLEGGKRIMAMRDWVEEKLAYTPGASNAETTAVDTFVSRRGICRDYAHLLISLARASAIPARMVSVYALGVKPPDFHAVCEVYLDDAWHLVDPTGMTTPDGIAKIGVGRDAADISFLTVYGQAQMNDQSVTVKKMKS